jgi:hypothetical protein
MQNSPSAKASSFINKSNTASGMKGTAAAFCFWPVLLFCPFRAAIFVCAALYCHSTSHCTLAITITLDAQYLRQQTRNCRKLFALCFSYGSARCEAARLLNGRGSGINLK